MKIGIFAGTFDPVHEGHLAFATAALAKVDKIIFLPEAKPWRKHNVTSVVHRKKMLQLATKHEPRFIVTTAPVERFTLDNVLSLLSHKYAPAIFSILLGADALAYLSDWEGIERYWDDVDFIVGRAASADLASDLPSQIKLQVIHHPELNRSSSDVRAGVQPTHAAIADYVRTHEIYT